MSLISFDSYIFLYCVTLNHSQYKINCFFAMQRFFLINSRKIKLKLSEVGMNKKKQKKKNKENTLLDYFAIIYD